MSSIKSEDVAALLRVKHADDIFVPECKTGPSQGHYHSRLDAWAMKRSWAHPLVIGYEIKVTRSDFLRDEKWRSYLPFCNQFSFVCPAGLIRVDEVGEDAGLIWVSLTGTRLYTKKKAPFRDVEIPDSIYKYILMSRTRITDPNQDQKHGRKSRAEQWAQWLKEKHQWHEIGYLVGQKVQEAMRHTRISVRKANEEKSKYQYIEERILELGFDPEEPVNQWEVDKELERRFGVMVKNAQRSLRNAKDSISRLLAELEGEESK